LIRDRNNDTLGMTTKPTKRSRPRAALVDPELLRAWPLPALDGKEGKEERGHVLVVGGSVEIPGAVILAATAALRAGAGKLQIATSRSVAPAVAIRMPEARVVGLGESARGELSGDSCRAIHDEVGRCDALLIGPGMMDARAGTRLLRHCVASAARAALIVDAAPLAAFTGRKPLQRRHDAGIVLTPHAGEMAKLWGVERDEVRAHALDIATEAAACLGAIVVLKGRHTWIVAPDGSAYQNTAGNVGLGTSGSGDALAGVIAGLCARGAEPLQAAVWGVYLHARAAEVLAKKMGGVGFLARELLPEIPRLLAALGTRRRRR